MENEQEAVAAIVRLTTMIRENEHDHGDLLYALLKNETVMTVATALGIACLMLSETWDEEELQRFALLVAERSFFSA